VPPRPAPPPWLITILNSLAVAVATWLCLAINEFARGLAGLALGVPFHGVEISAATRFLPLAHQAATTGLGAGAFALMMLAGVPGMILLAFVVFRIARGYHAAGWFRGLALAWLIVALLWLPAALIAASLPGYAGPVQDLYQRLGDPMAGRWTSAALGLLLLYLAGGALSMAALDVGRFWMRVDGVEFRRRLARTAAGWPAAVAVALLAFGAGWAPTPWCIPFLAVPPLVLHLRTH
jgi:hypothetical protein